MKNTAHPATSVPKIQASRPLRTALALVSMLILIGSSVAPAATLYWDANGATAGVTDGAGVWLTANQWFNTATAANSTWSSSSDAGFGIGGAGGAVTLASPTTANSLAFNYFTGTYTVGTAAQTLTLGGGGITKNGGTGVALIISNILLSAPQTWTNNTPGSLQATGGVDLNGSALTINGAGTTDFANAGTSNIITGAGGIIKNGTGTLILSNGGTTPLHNFTGGLTVNGGRVLFQSSAFLANGNTKLNGGYLAGRFGSGYTWSALGTGTNQIQITGGESGFSGEGTSGSTFQIGSALSTLQWGTTNFNPTALLLGGLGGNSNGVGSLNNAIDLNGSNRIITSTQVTDGASTSGFTLGGAITNSTGTAGLTKTGPGNVILNAANTYNGGTNINGGFLTLSAAAATINSTTSLGLSGGGILRLVNTSQVNRFADAAAITSNGGGITYTNTSGANVYTETVGTLGLVSGQTNLVLSTDQVGAGSQTLTIGTGGITRTGSTNTSAITFSALGAGLNATKNMIFVTGAGSSIPLEIIGPWATVGTTAALQTDYAVYASNFITGRGTAATTSDATWSTTLATTANYNFANGVTGTTLTATRNINSLQHTGGAETLTVATGANLGTFGILNGVTNLFTIAATGTGVVTLPTTSAGSLYVNAGSGAITINAPITNNTGALTLVKNGSSTLILNSNTNSYSGDTAINAGILQIGSGANTTGRLNNGTYAGNIFIGAGAALTFAGDATNTLSGIISGDGALNLNRGTTNLGSANTYTGKTSITLSATNATGSTIGITSFNSVFTDAGLGTTHSASSSLGAPTTVADGTIVWGGSVQVASQINFTGASETTDRIINFVFNSSGTRTIDNSGPAGSLLKFTSAPTSNGTTGFVNLQGSRNGEFVQGLPFAITTLNKSGSGTWTLDQSAGVTGTIAVSGGTLNLNGAQSNTTTNVTAGTLNLTDIVTGSAITVSGSGALNQSSTGSIVGAASVSSTGSGTTVLAGTNTYTGTTTSAFSNPAPTTTIIFQGMQALSPNTNLSENHVGGTGGFGIIKLLDDSATPATRSTVAINQLSSNTSHTLQLFVGNNSVANGGTSASTQTNSTIALGNLTVTQSVTGNTSQQLNVTGANGYKLQVNNLILATNTGLTSWSYTLNPTNSLIVAGNVTQTNPSTTVSATLVLDGTVTGNQINGNILQPGGGGAPLKLTKSNSSTWTLAGTNTYSGLTTISAGTLVGTNAQAFGDPTVNNIALGGTTPTLSMLNDGAGNNGTVIYGGPTASAAGYNITATTAGGANFNVGNNGSNTGNTIQLGTLATNQTLTFTNANNYNLAFGAASSTSAAILTNNMTNGTLTLASFTDSAASGQTLTFNGTSATANTVVTGTIAQNGANNLAITQSGSGTLTLSGANSSYGGITTVSSGTLVVGADAPSALNGALGNTNSAVVLGNASTLVGGAPTLLINGAFTVGRAITIGTGAVTAYNATLGGSNTSGTSTFSGNITLTNTGTYTTTLQAATGGTVDFTTGTWTNAGNKAITVGSTGNTGIVRLSNTLSTTGAVNVNFGTFSVNGTLSGGGTALTVASGAKLGGSGNITKNINIQSGGFFAPGNSIGTITETGDVTIAGTYQAELGTPGATPAAGVSDRTNITGNLTLTGGTLQLIDNAGANGDGSAGAGAYRLITFTGTRTGTFATVTNPLSSTLHEKVVYGSGTVDLNLYRLATANTITTPVTLSNVRVGGTFGTSALSIQNTASNDGFSEGLNATQGSTTGSASVSGTNISNLAGGSSSSTISVGLSGSTFTGTAGAVTGTVAIGLASSGTNSGYSDTSLTGQTITVNGSVYDFANAKYTGGTLAFGNVRTGASVSAQTVAFGNQTVTSASFQDLLDVSALTGNAKVTATGFTGLAASTSGATTSNLSLGVNTATAGTLASSETLTLTSNANGVAGLSNGTATVVGSPAAITTTGGVYDFANANYSGATLAFGNVHQGATVSAQTVSFGNTTVTNASFQDTLDVSASTGNAAVTATGFTGLAATTGGVTTNNLSFGVSTASVGSLASTASLTLTSNANGVAGLSNGTATVVGSPTSITTTGYVYSGLGVWNTDGNGNWSDFSKWTANGGAPGLDAAFTTTDTATFGSAATSANPVVTLNSVSPSLNAVTFNNSSFSYTLASSGGGTLILAGTTPSITTTGTHVISAPVTLAANSTFTTNASSQLTVSGAIGQSGGARTLTVSGPGTTVLSNATGSSYTGGTSVNSNGILLVQNTSNSATGSGAVTVDAGSKLGGTGLIAAPNITVNGDLMVGNTHASGGPVGQTLTLGASGGSVTLGGMVQFDILAQTGTGSYAAPIYATTKYDQLNSNDLLKFTSSSLITLNGTLDVASPIAYTSFAAGDTWRIFDWGGNTHDLSGLNISSLYLPDLHTGTTGLTWDVLASTTALDTFGTISVIGVPEPSRAVLMLIGAAGLLMRRRRARLGAN